MPQSSASSETFAQIDEWIRKCHQDHKQCTEEDVSWDDQPTRLLHLPPGSSRAMLIHGRAPKNQLLSAPPRYVTLSYRWGTATPSAPRLSLTQDNDVQLRRGIDVQALPRTLRDACLAVQRLGYQHIWIDRLCIFQDSPDDWATEAQTMARVYKNASLNIHAGRSAHEDSGIFQDSPIRGGYMPLQLRAGSPLPQQKAQASLPGWCWQSPQERREAVAPLSSHQDILVKLTSQEHYDSLAVKRGHLADRGWVFQERKFSRRKILFSSHLVHWECREAHASETEHMRSLPVLPENEDHILSWHLAVEEYSQTRLTFPGDRIWAIAGFARETIEGLRSTIPKEQYCMGLWKSSLLYDLAWISTKPVDASNQCIAPSWSWVSIGGAVEWPRMLTLQDSHDGRKVSVAELHAEPTKIELTHINPDDIFGPVINGRLRLHGRLRPVAVQDPNMRVLLPHARLRGWQLLEVRESWDRCGLVPRATTTWDDPVLMSAFLLPLYTAPRDFTDLTSTSQQIRVDCLILASSGTIDREGCTLRTARRRSFSTLDEEADWPDTYERLGVVLIANIAGAHVLHADLWSWLREYPARDVVIE